MIKKYNEDQIIQGIFSGDVNILSRAITLVESRKKEDRVSAGKIVQACLEKSGRSLRIGITGPPGAGKSTLIDALGMYALGQGKKAAVLSIDPSSSRNHGSILGDKTRMQRLFRNENAYIRPSPSSGMSGGVGPATREAVILCESCGFNFIMIETVGVGQGESAVRSLADFFLLVQIPGAGDELQGIKRGVLELADAVVINKADGDNLQRAQNARSIYKNAIMLTQTKEWGWQVPVEICSAQNEVGIDRVWRILKDYQKASESCGFLSRQRKEQSKYWFYEVINRFIQENFWSNTDVHRILSAKEKTVLSGKASPLQAAEDAISELKKL
ncbi:MAG: methylmalonyl Co-A mutase-associated GTPase MeaB [Spirochaetia bacterium]|nr:methylmalonyl Co-A mutase-associated GTPase MeaB [Spirochaetia bacterium]